MGSGLCRAIVQLMDMSFSDEFAYDLWAPNTNLTLTRVPWNNNASDIPGFETREEMNLFIDAIPGNINITFANDARLNEPIVIDALYTDVLEYNYIRATNNVQSAVTGSRRIDYYYFILGARHVATHTTEIVVQLDAWATFFDKIEIGNAFIEQGHALVADANNFENYGRNKLTVSEGLDIGSDYRTIITATEPLMKAPTQYSVLVASTLDLSADQGDTVADSKQIMSKGTQVNGLMSGASFYVFDLPESAKTYFEMISEKGWIGQGIQHLSAIPNLERFLGQLWTDRPNVEGMGVNVKYAPENPIPHTYHSALSNWREFFRNNVLPPRYSMFSKFLTSPYCIIEMTAFNGQPLILKPENWRNDDAIYGTAINILPPGQRATYYPLGYNANSGAPYDPAAIVGQRGDVGGDYFDTATTVSGFPTFAYVNNSASAILAGSYGGMTFSREAAEWSQTRNLEANRLGYEQAGSGIDLATSLTELANQGIREGRSISDTHAWTNAGIDTIGNIGDLSVGSGVLAGARAAMASSEANNQAALQQRQNTAASKMTGQNADYLRDTNRKMADWGARGDYSMQLAALNAKTRDINMSPPSTVGQAGGDMFNMVAANGGIGISVRFKMIDDGALYRIGEHWIRYGYQTHRRVNNITDLHAMTHFTFWKLQEMYLGSSRIPEGMKAIIMGMFAKGVTVWKDPSNIGKIDMGVNRPVEGYSL